MTGIHEFSLHEIAVLRYPASVFGRIEIPELGEISIGHTQGNHQESRWKPSNTQASLFLYRNTIGKLLHFTNLVNGFLYLDLEMFTRPQHIGKAKLEVRKMQLMSFYQSVLAGLLTGIR